LSDAQNKANNKLIELKNISKYFGAIRALHQVNFSVDAGEVIGLVGDNAAGKSTLMKIISGAYQPDEGEIYVEGKEVVWNSPKHANKYGISMIYQDFSLIPDLDVATNIFLGREPMFNFFGLKFLNKKKMKEESLDILQDLGLRVPPPTSPVKELSGGQQQAVAIARATGFDCKLVIMDEPTANLSPEAIDKLRATIMKLKRKHIAVIIISHRLEDIFETADRVVVMKHGEIAGERQVEETGEDEILELIIKGAK